MARFVAEAAAAVFMAVTGVVVARSLGPDGKGIVATMSFLVVVFALVGSLGLGDAAIIVFGQKRTSSRVITRTTTSAALIFGTLSALVLYPVLVLQFAAEWQAVRLAVPLAMAAVALIALFRSVSGLLEAHNRIVATAVAHVVMAAGTAAATVALVYVFRMSVAGAIGALAIGPVTGLVVLVLHAKRHSIVLAPGFDRNYLVDAAKLGVPAQTAYVLSALATRIDVVIVFALAGSVTAGHYSVAVTLGQLIVYAPYALAIATFPRLAGADDTGVSELGLRLVRATVGSALVFGGVLAVAIPLITVPVFGHGFAASVPPALLLLVAGFAASLQWVLCRIVAARGNTRVLFFSYTVAVAVMVALDFALIPLLGMAGAAIASMIASVIGIGIAYRYAHELLGRPPPMSLLPRLADVRDLTAELVRAVKRGRSSPRWSGS